MSLRLRTIIIGLVSLEVLLIVFLIYRQLTPQVAIYAEEELEVVVDSNIGEPNIDGAGRIGDTEVGEVRKARYIHRDKKTKEIDREWGFERLLHKRGDEWEIEKPFITIYERDFLCSVTGDRGRVRVESAADRPSPKDASLAGNVLIHISPTEQSDVNEAFIHLDDVIFDSERSQFSTLGPVRLTSEDAQMSGRGFELVYNDDLDRVELLRINHLESLRARIPSKGKLWAQAPGDSPKADGAVGKNVAGGSSGGQQQTPTIVNDASRREADRKKGHYYTCVFSENVVIDTPEQFVFADDEVRVNNIFWAKQSSEEPTETASADANSRQAGDDVSRAAGTPGAAKAAETRSEMPVARDVTVSKQVEPAQSKQEMVDITVYCDRGIVIMPMDSVRAQETPASPRVKAVASGDRRAKDLPSAEGQATCIARRIEHDVPTGDTILGGPVELTFFTDANDLSGAERGRVAVPVKVTAQNQGKFLSASKQAVLEGDCVATMVQKELGIEQEYTLSGPRFTVDLPEDTGEQSSVLGTEVDHLTADGGVVTLTIIKTGLADPLLAKIRPKQEGATPLGGIELRCRQIDYDAGEQEFWATGPGMVSIDNSKIPEAQAEVGRLSFRRQCYAFLRNFDTLKYLPDEDLITAEAVSKGALRVDYIPVIEGGYGEQVIATARHVEADLVKTAGGQTELATLVACGGITYEDEDKQFIGGELFYDYEQSFVKVQADESQQCYFNGMLVESIEYDLKTDEVKAEIAGPGTFMVNR